MKKWAVSVLAVVALAMLGAGCKKTESAADTVVYEPSRFIYTGWVVYEEHDDGKMYAVRQASLGDEISIISVLTTVTDGEGKDAVSLTMPVVEQKRAVRHLQSGEEAEFMFVHIYDPAEKQDFWTRDIFVASPHTKGLCVALQDASAYAAPDGISITKTRVKDGDYIVYLDTFASPDGAEENFVAATVYNGEPFGKSVYLKKDVVTGDATMVELIGTLARLDDQIKPAVRDEMVVMIVDNFTNLNGVLGTDDYAAYESYLTKRILALQEKAAASEHPFSERANRSVEYLTNPDWGI